MNMGSKSMRRLKLPPHQIGGAAPRQRGLVLFIALIVLVAMTLAGIAIVRSVDTTTVIAGNLAFHESATMGADSAIESAVTWINTNKSSLGTTDAASGYVATGLASVWSPHSDQNWRDFWDTTLASTHTFKELATDSAGNTASYFIQRLCINPGASIDPGQSCATMPLDDVDQSATLSKKAGSPQLKTEVVAPVLYRITVRVDGPRNTISFVQAIYAL